jgi:hypothetical protein
VFTAVFFSFAISAAILQGQQTSIALFTSANPVVFGQPVILTASISPAVAPGRVTFYDGVLVLGTRQLSAGLASLTTTFLTAGPHSLKAYYSGSGTLAAYQLNTASLTTGNHTITVVATDTDAAPLSGAYSLMVTRELRAVPLGLKPESFWK